ncbi:MAG: S9 family peptidase [Candidatus Heimdallarchaeota archaeon]|nr:S9 family peptidase [Candidatus Heimdallarchaeota archaeon]MCK4612136.1 S9 family peptidase [Candidatus Heimdallarchaeota archaeon]
MSDPLQPPVAKKELKITEIHGQKIDDDYFWLRFKENQEVIDYLTAENDYTKEKTKHLDTFTDELFKEMKNRIKEDDESVPYKFKDYYYYDRNEKGKEYKIYCRKHLSLENEEEILLDINELAKDYEYYKLRSFKISPNQNLLAYSVDTTGYEKFIIHIKDLETGETYAPGIENIGWNFEWGDDSIIFYNIRDEAQRPYALKRHIIGNPSERDVVIFEEKDTERVVYLWKSKDHRFLFMNSESTLSSEIRFLDLNMPLGDFKIFFPREEKHEYSVSYKDDYFYVVTNSDNSTNFKLVRTPVENIAKDNWEEILEHNEDVRIQKTEAFKNFLVIYKREEGLPKVDIFYEKDNEENHTIEFPESVYSVWRGDNQEYSNDFVRLSYTSLITPKSTYDYHVSTKKIELKKEDEIKNYKKEEYVTKRKFITARDGTQVPISIVHHKDINTPAPTYLYGYGSYGHNEDPEFSSSILSLTERGVIYVIAHIRGGGELGRPWYEDGKMLNKKNTFYDFIDTAENLIKENLTTKNQLVIAGGSAGGLLVGACVTMRPDLFHFVIARVPFVDVINTMLDASIPLTSQEWKEWGDPKVKEFFDYMLSYSPYDQIESRDYPHILVTTGLNDPRVAFWEPAKFVAKLRVLKTDNNDLILKTNMGAGHHGASGRYEYLKETAFIYANVLDKVGLVQK